MFCQEDFEGSKTLKIQLQLTSRLLTTRQLMIDRLLAQTDGWMKLVIPLWNIGTRFVSLGQGVKLAKLQRSAI